MSVDGGIKTITLPYQGSFQSLWAGDKLFILPIEDSMAIVDTDLQLTTLTPPIDIWENERVSGNLGITATNDIIWVADLPIETETGDYALYRTLSMENYEITEKQLPIPDSNWNWYEENPNPDLDDRLGTIIYTVDPLNEHVILCYQYMKEDGVIYSTLELYSPSNTSTIQSMECCCINNDYVLRGDTIIENTYPETCGETRVMNLSDLEPTFDISPYLSIKRPLNNWVGSNGNYWIILSDDEITVINEDRQFEASYQLPADLPQNWLRDLTFVTAFLITE